MKANSLFTGWFFLVSALVSAPAPGFGADYPTTVLSDSPLVYYRFSDAAAAANLGSLGAAGNGVYNGGAAPGAEAPRPPAFIGFEADNMALQLDGVDDFVASVAGLLNGRPAFTLSGWIRRAADQANRTGLFGQNDLVEFGYIDNNTLQAWTDNGLDHAPNPFPNGEWDYVALVSEGSPGRLTLYTNGLAAASRIHSLPVDNSFSFTIGGGGIFDTVGNFFNGQIDEVAVFDKALSAEAIARHYLSAVATAPRILVQPQSTNVFEGANVTLSVEAFGSPSLRYQWLDFTTPILGQTNSTLVFSNITEAQSSSYVVEVSNDYGTVQSATAEVIVAPTELPTITQQPQSASRYAGRPVTLTVQATGAAHLRYQWQKNEANIANATNNALLFPGVQASDAAGYRVIVTSSVGSTTSEVATVVVAVPAPGSYEEFIVDLDPKAYWRLNEPTGTVAHDFAGGYDGTYTAVAQGVPGALAGDADLAAEFDGTSSAVTTVSGLLNSTPQFTISGWIRRNADQANRTGLFGQNDLVEFGYIDNNTLQAWTDDGLNVAPNPFPNGEWAHVALVSDGSPGTLTTYTNGQAAASRTHSLPADNAFAFNIGGGGVFDGAGNFFAGRIDEVAVFGHALSASEIGCLYLAGTDKPLRIEIGPGNLIADSKPTGTPHDGAALGASWVAFSPDEVPCLDCGRFGVMQFVAAEADQITLAPNPDFNSPQGTITFWMRTLGTAGGGDFGAILFDRRPGGPGGAPGDVIVQQDDGHLFVQAASGSGGANSFSSSRVVNDDFWHHVAYVYDQSAGGSISLYIDGIADRSQANSAAWAWTPAQRIELGRSHDAFWRAFQGQLDDFRIYNRILTAEEVEEAADGALVDPAALKVRFNFDAGPTGVTLRWACGTLESTPSLTTPDWTTVPGAVSPFVVNQTGSTSQFYRLRR